MNLLPVIRRATIALAVLTSPPLTACGGAPKVALAPTRSVEFLLDDGGRHPQLRGRLATALQGGGYVVANGRSPRAVTVAVAVSSKASTSLFRVNGRASTTMTTTAAVTLVVDGGAGDHFSVSWEGPDAAPTEDALQEFVEKIQSSAAVAAFAEGADAREADRAAKAKAATDAKEAAAREEARRVAEEAAAAKKRQDADDDTAWLTAKSDACATPADVDACAPLEAWLKANPRNRHAQEALVIVDNARSAITRFRDDQAWGVSGSAACAKPSGADACDGVEGYLATFPSGAHAAEATTVLAASKAKVDAFKKAAAAKEAAAKKAEDAAACRADCKESVCAPYLLSAKFGVCLQRCIQNGCN